MNLTNGAKIAVIGGGPAGSFFSIFASRLAQELGKKLNITIYERKNFLNQGAAGCNMCAGVISESLVQLLALEGINLPYLIVQKGIGSYCFHTQHGKVEIKSSRLQQRGIATIFRGSGPKGSLEKGIQSFDDFLLNNAAEYGVQVKHILVNEVHLQRDKPVLYSGKTILQDCELLVGASGVKADTGKMYEKLGVGYRVPSTIKAMQSEIELGSDWITNHFGYSIHIFLLQIPGVKFVSVIPKGDFITVSMLVKEPDKEYVKTFLDHLIMKKMLPSNFKIPEKFCHCFPKINIKSAKVPFADRIVFVGDASSTRLFKDGIGSAYITSKAAAYTALLYGVGEKDFAEHYFPICKELNKDNLFGRFLFSINDLISISPFLNKGYFKIIQWEQKGLQKETPCSNILWDMFTGSRFYKDILIKSLNPWPLMKLLSTVAASYVKEIIFSFRKK